MEIREKYSRPNFFEKFASQASKATGSDAAIIIAFAYVTIMALLGILENFSSMWQLVSYLSITIVTFLMVFLIQKSRNKDSLAIQLKLNELIASHDMASNRMVDVEHMTEAELKVIQKYYSKLSSFINKEVDLQQSHSIDEVEADHDIKRDMEEELAEKT